MKIHIETIPHKEQRYETPGDYWLDDKDVIQLRVSQLSDWRYEALIIIHELVEIFLCKLWNIEWSKIDAFDIQFEKERKQGLHLQTDEPGDNEDAPYYWEHQLATAFEKMLSGLMGVVWKKYDEEVVNLIQ